MTYPKLNFTELGIIQETFKNSSEVSPTYVCLWKKGQRIFWRWYTEASLRKNLIKAETELSNFLTKNDEKTDQTIHLEINLTQQAQSISLESLYRLTSLGIYGLNIYFKGKAVRVSPTDPIVQNVPFKEVLSQFFRGMKITESDFIQGQGQVEIFEAKQVFINLQKELKEGVQVTTQAKEFYRGKPLVELTDIKQAELQKTAELMANWMQNNLNKNGRLSYMIWPSISKESMANNMIRQFMGTVCLFQWAEFRKDKARRESAEKNLSYNMTSFFRTENDWGFIEEKTPNGKIKVKLGACALAGLSILASDRPEEDSEQHRDSLKRLERLIDKLWQNDGSFKTFYIPSDRNDCQNFYPGEALLLWATIYCKNPEANDALLKRFYQSVDYYQCWHEANKNPAFIPWHTQAYYLIWKKNHNKQIKNEKLKDAIFKMNDWLLALQQWDNHSAPDLQGRFFNPTLNSGAPHASATGVYLESLIDAYALAKEIGDKQRKESYRIAILRALRSLTQLQFRDEEEMFYVQHPQRVLGGIRTTVFNNSIRVDNVQHNLMAVIRILQRFEPQDFDLP